LKLGFGVDEVCNGSGQEISRARDPVRMFARAYVDNPDNTHVCARRECVIH
jgi:hypothetical protein